MASPPSKTQTFWRRLGSTIGLWTIVLLGLFAPNEAVANTAFLGVIGILGSIGYFEFAKMVTPSGSSPILWPPIVAGIAFILLEASSIQSPPVSQSVVQTVSETAPGVATTQTEKRTVSPTENVHTALVPALLVLWLGTLKLRSGGEVKLATLATTLFGWFYIFWLLQFLVKIYYFPGISGQWLLFYFILVTKFSDLGAYVVGSLLGKHKMAPTISPGKTWEGFAGALLIPTMISLVTIYTTGSTLEPLHRAHGIILGVLLGSCAVVGDLCESLIKREAGAKDSGNLFPGIGGSLDLLDSLLFNAPIFYLYCRFALTAN